MDDRAGEGVEDVRLDWDRWPNTKEGWVRTPKYLVRNPFCFAEKEIIQSYQRKILLIVMLISFLSGLNVTFRTL